MENGKTWRAFTKMKKEFFFFFYSTRNGKKGKNEGKEIRFSITFPRKVGKSLKLIIKREERYDRRWYWRRNGKFFTHCKRNKKKIGANERNEKKNIAIRQLSKGETLQFSPFFLYFPPLNFLFLPLRFLLSYVSFFFLREKKNLKFNE